MARLVTNWAVSYCTEILVMGATGMFFTGLEERNLNIQGYLTEVQNINFPADVSQSVRLVIKLILSLAVLVRGFTVHAHIISYLMLLWSVFFYERPYLILPWLVVAAVKELVTRFVTMSTGLFFCGWTRHVTPVCVEFLAMEVIQLVLSSYLWYSVYEFYLELEQYEEGKQIESEKLHCQIVHTKRLRCKSVGNSRYHVSQSIAEKQESSTSLEDDRLKIKSPSDEKWEHWMQKAETFMTASQTASDDESLNRPPSRCHSWSDGLDIWRPQIHKHLFRSKSCELLPHCIVLYRSRSNDFLSPNSTASPTDIEFPNVGIRPAEVAARLLNVTKQQRRAAASNRLPKDSREGSITPSVEEDNESLIYSSTSFCSADESVTKDNMYESSKAFLSGYKKALEKLIMDSRNDEDSEDASLHQRVLREPKRIPPVPSSRRISEHVDVDNRRRVLVSPLFNEDEHDIGEVLRTGETSGEQSPKDREGSKIVIRSLDFSFHPRHGISKDLSEQPIAGSSRSFESNAIDIRIPVLPVQEELRKKRKEILAAKDSKHHHQPKPTETNTANAGNSKSRDTVQDAGSSPDTASPHRSFDVRVVYGTSPTDLKDLKSQKTDQSYHISTKDPVVSGKDCANTSTNRKAAPNEDPSLQTQNKDMDSESRDSIQTQQPNTKGDSSISTSSKKLSQTTNLEKAM